jgi:hypothetical protein
MLESFLTAVFGCQHRRTTWPRRCASQIQRLALHGASHYIVCLECGREYGYDWKHMQLTH